MTSTGAETSGVMPHIGPMRDPPSESSASPQASSTTRSSAVSYENPRSSLSPSQVYINKENLTAPATNSQVVALGEQLNILIALSEEYTRWQKKNIRWQKKNIRWQKKNIRWQKKNIRWQKKTIRWQKKNIRWQKKVTKVLVEVGTKLDVPTDGLESEDEDPAGDLA